MIAHPGAGEALERWNAQRREIFYPKSEGFPAPEYLKKLSDFAAGFIPLLRAKLGPLLEEEIKSVEHLKGLGTFHQLFRVQTAQNIWILKAALAEETAFSFLNESFAASEFRKLSLPSLAIPEFRTTISDLPFPFLIIEQAKGTNLRQLEDAQTQAIPWPLLHELGRTVARYHTVTASGAGLLRAGEPRGVLEKWIEYIHLRLEDHIRLCLEIGAISKDESDEINRRFFSASPLLNTAETRLLHGDLGHHNIFGDRERITAIIDWEDALAGDPIFDIAYWGTFVRDEMRAEFLEAYASVTPLPSDFEYRYWLYYLRIALSKTVHRHHFKTPDHPGRPPASQRIQKALSNLRKL